MKGIEYGQPLNHLAWTSTRPRDIRLGIPVLLGHSEIDDVNDIFSLGTGTSDQEVVGLDVTVDQVLFMNRLDPGDLDASRWA